MIKSKHVAMAQAYHYAIEYTPKYDSCCLGTSLAVQKVFTCYNDILFRAASGLGAGLAYKGDVCGALIGGCMMLGLEFGLTPDKIDGPDNLHSSYPMVQAYYEWFKNEFGTTNCRELRGIFAERINYDHLDIEQREKEIYDELHRQCDKLTGRAASKITELIYESRAATIKVGI